MDLSSIVNSVGLVCVFKQLYADIEYCHPFGILRAYADLDIFSALGKQIVYVIGSLLAYSPIDQIRNFLVSIGQYCAYICVL